jgi:putative phosphoesterase
MLIGVISDTHLPSDIQEIWPEVPKVFESVDLILHAGDIIAPSVLDSLQQVSPVLAARGNHDHFSTTNDPRVKNVHILKIEGWNIGLIHDLEPEDRPIDFLIKHYIKAPVDIMISGHTHFERIDFRDNVLQLNPGSSNFPHLLSTRLGTVALLKLEPGIINAEVILLGNTTDRPNPGTRLSYHSS